MYLCCFLAKKYRQLCLNCLTTSLLNESDLSFITRDLLPKVLWTLCIGCDCLLFCCLWKVHFLKVFFSMHPLSVCPLSNTCDTSRYALFEFCSSRYCLRSTYLHKTSMIVQEPCSNASPVVVPSRSISNGLTALGPLCGRTLSLRMSFLHHGRSLDKTGSAHAGCHTSGAKHAAIRTDSYMWTNLDGNSSRLFKIRLGWSQQHWAGDRECASSVAGVKV